MARKRKSKARRRTYKAPARRRTARRSPARSSKRRAVSKRRRVRRNPKGFFGQPAVQYGIAATVGAGISMALESRPDLKIGADPVAGKAGYSAALVGAAAVLAAAQFWLKGKNKSYAYSVGVGMLLPQVSTFITDGVNNLLPAKNGNGNGNGNGTAATSTQKLGAMRSLPSMRTAYSAPGAKRAAVAQSTSRMKTA
jgi:hypothetical protein